MDRTVLANSLMTILEMKEDIQLIMLLYIINISRILVRRPSTGLFIGRFCFGNGKKNTRSNESPGLSIKTEK